MSKPIYPVTQVEPHGFLRLSFFRRRTCRRCYWHREDHPMRRWTIARHLGDHRRPMRINAKQAPGVDPTVLDFEEHA